MNRTAGVLLLVVGVIILVWGAFGFTTKEEIIDVGPIEATKETRHDVPWAPIAGGAIMVGGIVLLVAGRRG
jgi:hypothetical protein